ncbi:unnamed protein product [Lactuca saligna]|uniref:Histone deacetylase n=1 Tax=Lactuca saligna TaxID=75948 RepID=A0AA35VYM8_LACSI|nr:unnamed protein product [Lactuca saligna]
MLPDSSDRSYKAGWRLENPHQSGCNIRGIGLGSRVPTIVNALEKLELTPKFRGSEIVQLQNFRTATAEDVASVHTKSYIFGLEKFNGISVHVVCAILLYILNQGIREKSPKTKSRRNFCGWWRTWNNGIGSRGGVIYGVKHTLYYWIWIWEMFPLARGNAAIQRNNLYPRILRWFHLSMLSWEKVCDHFDVDQNKAHQPRRKMIASDVESSTAHYLTYITSLNPESSEVPSSVRYNFRKEGNENVDGTYHMPNPVIQQFGSPRNSNRVNEDDDVDCRKQKQIMKKKKKKKVFASDIVDAENHIAVPRVAKPRCPVRVLKPSQHLSSPYVSVQNAPRYRPGGVIRNEPPPPVSFSDPPTILLGSYGNPGCTAPSLYMGNKPVVFLKHRLYNERIETRFWDLLFYESDLGFLDEAI